jgi:serine protease inhibitor
MKHLIIRLATIVAGLLTLTYQPGSRDTFLSFPVASSAEIASEMMGIDPDVHGIVTANNRFAVDLYQQLSQREGNLFFSPYSLSTALAMTYAGAAGQTAEKMAEVLHFSLEPQAIHSGFSQVAHGISLNKSEGYQIYIANRLWGQKNYGFLASFLQLTEEYYGAALAEVDFQTQPESARDTINQWVAAQTQENITDLIPAGVLNASTRLVLTNAIFFQGNWLYPFELKNTQKTSFTTNSGQEVTVPMMYQKNRFWYGKYDGVEVLRLFYLDYGLSMVILLPETPDKLAQLEEIIGGENLDSFISCADREYMVELWLPKFKIAAEFDLKETLSRMGMEIAFNQETANFSGMNGSPEDLYLSAVVHKAFLDVNEVGTEAGGASGVVAASRSTVPAATFRADHPFIFLIQDNESDSILFLGRVVNPLN